MNNFIPVIATNNSYENNNNATKSESLVYSSRRRFLASAGNSNNGVLQPPKEFKTRRHARREYLQHVGSSCPTIEESHFASSSFPHIESNLTKQKPHLQGMSGILQSIFSSPALKPIATPKAHHTDTNTPHSRHVVSKKGSNKAQKLVIIDDSLVDAKCEDWTEASSGGVRYWINKNTGAVLTDCPWAPPNPHHGTKPHVTSQKIVSANTKPVSIAEEEEIEEDLTQSEEGTGSLVYDSSEIDDFFALLDSLESQKKVTASNKRKK